MGMHFVDAMTALAAVVAAVASLWNVHLDLHLAAQAAPITIELPTAVSAAAWAGAVLLAVIGALAGLCVWFLRREIINNDAAHTELRRDVKKLLEGDVAWVKALLGKQ